MTEEQIPMDETKPVSTEKMDQLLQLNCPTCGSKMRYSAEKNDVRCTHCGYAEPLDKASSRVAETSLEEAIHKAENSSSKPTDPTTYHCSNCGANVMYDPSHPAIKCGFCGSKNVNEQAFQTNYIQPSGIIPFTIAKSAANDLFRNWLGKGFFTPKALKSAAELSELKGIYIPFWTFDAETYTQWSGYAGYYYYITKTRTVNGKTETYQERQVRWVPRSGDYAFFFDDTLVSGTKSINNQTVQKLSPFNLKSVINYDPKALLGWDAEVYSVSVKDGYHEAEKTMDSHIKDQCAKLLSADTYKDLRTYTIKSKQTFKHILLPIWICAYLFNGKSFAFMVNGQTGKVSGKKPVDNMKVALVVMAAILLLIILYFIFKSSGN